MRQIVLKCGGTRCRLGDLGGRAGFPGLSDIDRVGCAAEPSSRTRSRSRLYRARSLRAAALYAGIAAQNSTVSVAREVYR